MQLNCYECGAPTQDLSEKEIQAIRDDLGLDADEELADCCDECAVRLGFKKQSAQIFEFKRT